MSVLISAVICTHNRADYLRKAIESLVEQTLSKEQYEIIVVDNGSTDNTRQVVLEEFSSAPNLRYLYEPILGLSQARNTGWQNARGEYVGYLDDDAIACPKWLERILEIFESVSPRPGCVGGKIEPIWEIPRPPWLSDELKGYLTILDWSETPITLSDKQWLAGANIALPRHLLKATGGFQVNLGRKGSKLLSAEETLLRQQLENRGYCCFYHPEISVHHHIPASRLTRDWFLRRAFWSGVSNARVRVYLESPSALKRLGMLIYASLSLVLLMLQSLKRLIGLMGSTNSQIWFTVKHAVLNRIGYIIGVLWS